MHARALQIEWSRVNTERFRKFLSEPLGRLSETKVCTAFEGYAKLVHLIYAYLCARSEIFDKHVMGIAEYWEFLRDTDLVDEDSQYFKSSDVENIFIASNVEDAAVTSEQADVNNVNPDRALMRFEFLAVLARISVSKYTKIGVEDNGGKPLEVHSAVARYLSELHAKLPPEATYDPDRFRRAHLYHRPIHDILSSNERNLKPIFEYYAAGADDRLVVGKAQHDTQDKLAKAMSIDEWIACLSDARLIAPSSSDPCEFGLREAKLAYVYAHAFVSDEIYRRERLTHIVYVEFLEAIARVAWMRNMPTPAHLQQLKMASYAEYLERTAEADGGLVIEGKYTSELPQRGHAWMADESDVPLGPQLQLLLSYMVHTFDANQDGKISKKELQASAEKRKQQAKDLKDATKRRAVREL